MRDALLQAIDGFFSLFGVTNTNTQIALLGTGLLGLAAGAIGSLAVLRRRALMGDALSHAALPGIWVAFFLLRDRQFTGLLAGAAVSGTLGILAVTFIRKHTRVKEDAAIGIVLSVFFAMGLCLSRMIQNAGYTGSAGLDSFLYGKAAAMLWEDVAAVAAVAAVVLLGIFLFEKEFRALCFDRDFAAAQGWPVLRLDVLMMLLLVLCTVVGLPAAGVVLMAALLIIPGAAARFWTERLSLLILLASAIGCLCGLAGSAVSARYDDVSTGPAVVLAGGGVFLVSMLFAPRRGLLADALRRLTLRRKVGLQNLLRTMYEQAEARSDASVSLAEHEIIEGRAWTGREALRQLRRARRIGLVEPAPAGYRFTPSGAEAARRVVRAHRLWEMFLVEHAAIAPDHVDRDADQIEHVLPPDLIARLEGKLRLQGRLPVPASPHRLGESAV